MAWEKVALDLAEASGIFVPGSTLIDISGRSVLILHRFDRTATNARIGYASALTLLEASDGERRSYLEIGEVIEEHSPHATKDLNQLWKRMTFSVLISNTDDHLRNHAFLHRGWDSWALSPAFDLNPDPSVGPKELCTAITDHDASAQVDLLMEVAEFFRLDVDAAAGIARDIATVVGQWRACAQTIGLSSIEIAQMEPAFVHEASNQAVSL
jgi:serine/threonine-protein kinase HipA